MLVSHSFFKTKIQISKNPIIENPKNEKNDWRIKMKKMKKMNLRSSTHKRR